MVSCRLHYWTHSNRMIAGLCSHMIAGREHGSRSHKIAELFTYHRKRSLAIECDHLPSSAIICEPGFTYSLLYPDIMCLCNRCCSLFLPREGGVPQRNIRPIQQSNRQGTTSCTSCKNIMI